MKYDNITFTVIISNYGPSNAENIIIKLNLPNNIIIDPLTMPIGTYDGEIWNIPQLNNGSNVTLNITGILNTSGTFKFSGNIKGIASGECEIVLTTKEGKKMGK